MNNVAAMNESTFNYMKKTFVFQFKNIHFNNNTLTFNGDSVLLKDFELETILNYNSWVIGSLSEEEIFDIIKTHAIMINLLQRPSDDLPLNKEKLQPITISGDIEEKKNELELINIERFLMLTRKKEDYTEQEKKEIDTFFELYKKMCLYEDYLTPEAKKILILIKKILNEIEVEVLEL